MTVYIYAETERRALQWDGYAAVQRARCRVFGNCSANADGFTYQPDDRVVVLGGEVAQWLLDAVERNRCKSPEAPAVEYITKDWATCCGGTGYADYAAVPCPNPACPVTA